MRQIKMRYRVNQYRKPAEHKIVEGILRGLWWFIKAPFKLIFKKSARINYNTRENVYVTQDYVNQKWSEIEQLMQLGKPSNYARAVLEADKLLDHVLKGLRAPGITMGDRLKSSKNRFSHDGYNAVWQGHKIRNELVHNSEYEVTDFIAKHAIENFKIALSELVRI